MTERIQPNPFDAQVADMVNIIKEVRDGVRETGRNVRPYGDGFGPRERMTAADAQVLYDNPSEHVRLEWPELATDQATQLPITNAQATQILLQKMGPAKYRQYVLENARRQGGADV